MGEGGGVGDENFLFCPEGGSRKVPLQAEVSLRTSGIGLGCRISDFVLGRLMVLGYRDRAFGFWEVADWQVTRRTEG